MKSILVFFVAISLPAFLASCSDEAEDANATWGDVNKEFVELEKERVKTFDLLKEKPNKNK